MQQATTEHKRHVRKANLEDAAVIQKFNWSMAKVMHERHHML
jgi:hypothetical protein